MPYRTIPEHQTEAIELGKSLCASSAAERASAS